MKTIPSVLIVDDSHLDRRLLVRDLKKIGFEGVIYESENGQEALDFLLNYEKNKKVHSDKFPPLVIFLDINMPFVNGFEFLEKFNEVRDRISEYQVSVLVMVSSSKLDSDRQRALEYDFVKDYLVKGDCGTAESLKKIDTYLEL